MLRIIELQMFTLEHIPGTGNHTAILSELMSGQTPEPFPAAWLRKSQVKKRIDISLASLLEKKARAPGKKVETSSVSPIILF